MGAVKCYTNIVISNLNENPTILTSSLTAERTVPEDALPGRAIGKKLVAVDAEVTAGLQQLTWRIISCEPYTFSRTGLGAWQTTQGSAENCHIKLSSCDGQLSVQAGTILVS